MMSLRQHFQNLRNVSSQFFVKIMWSKFHRNRSHSVQIKGCYRQTHRRTDRDRPGDNIFSNEMTEYKNATKPSIYLFCYHGNEHMDPHFPLCFYIQSFHYWICCPRGETCLCVCLCVSLSVCHSLLFGHYLADFHETWTTLLCWGTD